MRLTTKGRYGVMALVDLAASYTSRPVSIKSIAGEVGISPEYLEQIFFKLKKAGVIDSLRGPGGGFVLSKKASEITLKEILDAVGETTHPVPCTNPEEMENCARREFCAVASTWSDFAGIINEFLDKLTINDILKKSGSKFYEDIVSGQDFSI